MSQYIERKLITEIAFDAIHDDAFQGPRMFYAWDGAEDSTCWSGPHTSVAEALDAYLDEQGPADEDAIEVTLGKPLTPPRARFDADELLDDTCDEDWPEQAVERVADAVKEHGRALEDAVTALVRRWCDDHVDIDLFWRGYGRALETNAGDARAFLAALAPAGSASAAERGGREGEGGNG